VEHGRARHVALLQAHAPAVLEVDGGEEDHRLNSGATSPRQTPGSAAPALERAKLARAMDPGIRPDDRRAHGAHFKTFSMSFSPSFALFSGWNCVPAMMPRATIAVTAPP